MNYTMSRKDLTLSKNFNQKLTVSEIHDPLFLWKVKQILQRTTWGAPVCWGLGVMQISK